MRQALGAERGALPEYGELPLDEMLAMLGANTLNAEQEKLITTGMEVLVGVLGMVRSLTPDLH